jgi:Rrf2 family protein
MLMGILNQLARRGLVISTRGAKGGYRLAREPEQITLAQIIDAVEGPVRLTMCCMGHDDVPEPECDLEAVCDVKQPLQAVQRRLETFLSEVNLADIAWNTMPVELNVSVGTKLSASENAEPDAACVGTVAG